MLQRTCLAGRFTFRVFRTSLWPKIKAYSFPWFLLPPATRHRRVLPPFFLHHLACILPIYVKSFFRSPVSHTWEPYRTAPHAFYEHITTAHAVYTRCTFQLFPGFPLNPSHLIGIDPHPYVSSHKLILLSFCPCPAFPHLLFYSCIKSHLPSSTSWSPSFMLSIPCTNVYVHRGALKSPSYLSSVFT